MHNTTIVLVLAIADVLTGVANAWIEHNIQSKVFKKGLLTHIIAVAGCYGFNAFAPALNMETLITPVLISVIMMYGISLLENYQAMGGQLPDFIAKHIKPKGGKQ